MSGSPTPRTQLPPRLLPVLYFGAAHVALALAFGAVAIDPRGVSGFFYHARMLGIVHLIALGWITASDRSPCALSPGHGLADDYVFLAAGYMTCVPFTRAHGVSE